MEKSKEKRPETKSKNKQNKTQDDIPYPGWEPLKFTHYTFKRKPGPDDEPIEHYFRKTGRG